MGLVRRNAPPEELYAKDPVRYLVEVLGIPERTLRWSLIPAYETHTWDGDRDPLVVVLEALAAGLDTGVESGTGTGKTYLAAGIVCWFLDCFEHSVVVTAAPKESQLKLHLWKEVGRLWPRFQERHPNAQLDYLHIRMRPPLEEWSAIGFPVGVGASESVATRAQGFHEEHLLIITEETPGIDPAIMAAFENTCAAPHNLRLALGNPDSPLDELHKFCQVPGTRAVRISAQDHPNVVCDDPSIVPGAISKGQLAKRRDRLGADSPLYLSRGRGICPDEASDSLIRLSWCFAARDRARTPEFQQAQAAAPEARGVDVANSENGDRGAIARGRGAWLKEVETFACPDANQLGGKYGPLGMEIRDQKLNPELVGVDGVGVGAGTVNELKRQRIHVRKLNGGDAPIAFTGTEEKFLNLRSQMWWQMRDDLQHGVPGLPADDELFADLCAPKWETRNGKIVIEPKEAIKARLGRSPDKGDAAVYWNWVRAARAAVTTGGAFVSF